MFSGSCVEQFFALYKLILSGILYVKSLSDVSNLNIKCVCTFTFFWKFFFKKHLFGLQIYIKNLYHSNKLDISSCAFLQLL